MNILEVNNISKNFEIEQPIAVKIRNFFTCKQVPSFCALNNVSFNVKKGEILGILGESGSGKSTLAKILMGIYSPDSGTAELNSQSIFNLNYSRRLKILRKMQMVFQDPFSSLDPRMTVRRILSEPLKIHGIKPETNIEEFLAQRLKEVGMDPSALNSYPSEFSGGQRQRIGICRALMLNPELLIADEAVSALDVSVQAQILELLLSLQKRRNLSLIFISHDVAVVRQISDRIILLYKGRLVEEIDADKLLTGAKHEYTKRLLESALYLRENIS